MKNQHQIYVGTDVEMAAIIAAVLRWVAVEPALPRGDHEKSQRYWHVPRADHRSMFDALGTDSEIPADFRQPVDLYAREEVIVFGQRFIVWRKQ